MLIAISLTILAQAEDEAAGLSGTWILDPGKTQSKYTNPTLGKVKVEVGGVFSGKVDDPAETQVSPDRSAWERVSDLVITISQSGQELQITRRFTLDGEQRTVLQKFSLDGAQCMNLASNGRGEFVSRSTWGTRVLVNSGMETATVRERRVEISAKEEYAISKDGKKLTIKTINSTSNGVTTVKQVFRRQ